MPYPSDVSGKKWAFVVLYLVLVYASEHSIWLRLVNPIEIKRGALCYCLSGVRAAISHGYPVSSG